VRILILRRSSFLARNGGDGVRRDPGGGEYDNIPGGKSVSARGGGRGGRIPEKKKGRGGEGEILRPRSCVDIGIPALGHAVADRHHAGNSRAIRKEKSDAVILAAEKRKKGSLPSPLQSVSRPGIRPALRGRKKAETRSKSSRTGLAAGTGREGKRIETRKRNGAQAAGSRIAVMTPRHPMGSQINNYSSGLNHSEISIARRKKRL